MFCFVSWRRVWGDASPPWFRFGRAAGRVESELVRSFEREGTSKVVSLDMGRFLFLARTPIVFAAAAHTTYFLPLPLGTPPTTTNTIGIGSC